MSRRFPRRVLGGMLLALALLGRAQADQFKAVVVIDASGSMKANDGQLLSKVAAKLFVDLAGPEDEIAVMAFGTRAAEGTLVPGKDKGKLKELVSAVGQDHNCTDYADGLEAAARVFGSKASAQERPFIIFLTDGRFEPNPHSPAYHDDDSAQRDEALAGLLRRLGRRGPDLAERGLCDHVFGPWARRSDRELAKALRERFQGRMEALLAKDGALGRLNVPVFTIGLGDNLSQDPESMALLSRIASATGGHFYQVRSANQLPAIFIGLYSRYLGAVSQEAPLEDEASFQVQRGARDVAFVIPTSDPSLKVELAHAQQAWPFGKGENEAYRVDDYNEVVKGRRPSAEGYRFFKVRRPEAGKYTIRRTAGSKDPLTVTMVQSLGLKVALEGVTGEVLQGDKLQAQGALRTAMGDKVALPASYLEQIHLSYRLGTEGNQGEWRPLDLAGKTEGTIVLGTGQRGTYTVEVKAAHQLGYFQGEAKETYMVVPQFTLAFKPMEITFHTMAEAGPLVTPEPVLEVDPRGTTLDVLHTFKIDLTGVSHGERLNLGNGSREVILGKGQGSLTFPVSLRDPEALRDQDIAFEGDIRVRAANPRLFKGRSEWTFPVRGRVIPWDLARYYQEYRTVVWASAGGLGLVFLLLGLVLPSSFPKKAMLYYLDSREGNKEVGSYPLGRRNKRLPFRSARHRIGKGGDRVRKRGKVLYCVIQAGHGGFTIKPSKGVKVRFQRDDRWEEQAGALRGRYGERYQVAEDLEFWVLPQAEG